MEGVPCCGLLDTGSMVTTISEQFVSDHLPHILLQPISHLLTISSSTGHPLPYMGYIEVDITYPDLTGKTVTKSVLALVVPQTLYNSDVPVLIGTNVIQVYS